MSSETRPLRLRLEPLGTADRAAFLAATRRSRRLHRPWVHPPTTAAGVDAFVSEIGPDRERLLLWGEERARRGGSESRELLGYFALSAIIRGALNGAFLGYWAVSPHTGQGYMSAGMDLLLRHAFRNTRLHRIEANIQPENHSSIALVRRAGFVKEGFSPRYLKIAGRWRDHERWAIRLET